MKKNSTTPIAFALLLTFIGSVGASYAQRSFMDSLIATEFSDQPEAPILWHYVYPINMINFVLQDECYWGLRLETVVRDTTDLKITLTGHGDRQVGAAEFRRVLAADLARADTLLTNYRKMRASVEIPSKPEAIRFTHDYERAYGRDLSISKSLASK